MVQPMRAPEQPSEQFPERPKDAVPVRTEQETPRAEMPREREVVQARATVIEDTRRALAEVARRLPRIEGARQDSFVA